MQDIFLLLYDSIWSELDGTERIRRRWSGNEAFMLDPEGNNIEAIYKTERPFT